MYDYLFAFISRTSLKMSSRSYFSGAFGAAGFACTVCAVGFGDLPGAAARASAQARRALRLSVRRFAVARDSLRSAPQRGARSVAAWRPRFRHDGAFCGVLRRHRHHLQLAGVFIRVKGRGHAGLCLTARLHLLAAHALFFASSAVASFLLLNLIQHLGAVRFAAVAVTAWHAATK